MRLRDIGSARYVKMLLNTIASLLKYTKVYKIQVGIRRERNGSKNKFLTLLSPHSGLKVSYYLLLSGRGWGTLDRLRRAFHVGTVFSPIGC